MSLSLSSKICSRCFTRHPTKKSQSVETLRREPQTNDSAHVVWTVSCGAGPQRKSSTQTYPAFCLGICDSLLPGVERLLWSKKYPLKAGSVDPKQVKENNRHHSINPSIHQSSYIIFMPLPAPGSPWPKRCQLLRHVASPYQKKRRLRGVKGRNFHKSSQSSRGKTLHLQKNPFKMFFCWKKSL